MAALREQNEQLTQQLTTAEEQRLENERLRSLLNLRDTYEIEGVAARVIGRSTDAWNLGIGQQLPCAPSDRPPVGGGGHGTVKPCRRHCARIA